MQINLCERFSNADSPQETRGNVKQLTWVFQKVAYSVCSFDRSPYTDSQIASRNSAKIPPRYPWRSVWSPSGV